MVEEAVLREGGGEAEAGLLRSFRTVRGVRVVQGVRGETEEAVSDSTIGGGARSVGELALAGEGRGQVEGGELSPLVAILEQVRRMFEGGRGREGAISHRDKRSGQFVGWLFDWFVTFVSD